MNAKHPLTGIVFMFKDTGTSGAVSCITFL
jgi:hypothetical protein